MGGFSGGKVVGVPSPLLVGRELNEWPPMFKCLQPVPPADDDNRITMREMLRLRLEAKSAEVTRLKERCADYADKCDAVWPPAAAS